MNYEARINISEQAPACNLINSLAITFAEGKRVIDDDREAIEKVIVEAYIDGIHRTQEKRKIESGFHPGFAMLVLKNNNVEKVSVSEWLDRIEKMKKADPELWQSRTSYGFQEVNITGNAAMAKLDVYKGTKHFSTDYMLLYKLNEGWKIVSKIFAVP